MKKLLALILACAAFAALAFAADQLVLSTSTKSGGVTTTVTVGRIQGDPASDGSLTISAIPRQIVTLADGTVLSDSFAGTWITVKLSPTTTAAIYAEIAAASKTTP